MDIRTVGVIAALLTVGCRHTPATHDWGVIAAFPYEARIKTSWRQDELLYLIQMPSDSQSARFTHDSVPSRILLSFYDSAGFDVMDLDLPLTSSGFWGAAYSSGKVPCPATPSDAKCDRSSYTSATRVTASPYSFVPPR